MKFENMILENVYLNGNIDRVDIYFRLPILQGIYLSNIVNLSIFIDGQESDPYSTWLRKGNFEIPFNHLSVFKYEYIDPKETISIIIKNPKALSQGKHKIEIQTTYLKYYENKHRQINKYQPFSCEVSNRFQ